MATSAETSDSNVDSGESSGEETKKPLWKRFVTNPWVIAFFIGAVTLLALRPFLQNRPEPPPVLSTLPVWELQNQEGEAFGSGDLEGEVYIVNFFFTSCPSICPPMMQQMLALQDRFDRAEIDVRLLSFSVDPENDTPAVLKEYGDKLGTDFDRWTYITGPEQQVRDLVIDGFKTHVGEKVRDDNNIVDIAHVGKVVLVDQKGRIRGYYNSDESGMDEVYHRSQHVLDADED